MLKTKVEATTFESCMRALAIVSIEIMSFHLRIASDFFTLAANIFLISSSMKNMLITMPGLGKVTAFVEDLANNIGLSVRK